MAEDPTCECGRPIERRGASGQVPPKCKQCMKEWAADQLDIDLKQTSRHPA